MFTDVSSGTDYNGRYDYIGVFISYLERILEIMINFFGQIFGSIGEKTTASK